MSGTEGRVLCFTSSEVCSASDAEHMDGHVAIVLRAVLDAVGSGVEAKERHIAPSECGHAEETRRERGRGGAVLNRDTIDAIRPFGDTQDSCTSFP